MAIRKPSLPPSSMFPAGLHIQPEKLAALRFSCYLRRQESHRRLPEKNFGNMGRNKFAQDEIKEIAKLLRLKNAGNRAKQKLVRHDLRTLYGFNIADFNKPGKAFGETDLHEAIERGAIEILDDATIADMKAKHARDKARDEAERERLAIASGEMTDWKASAKEWEEWEKTQAGNLANHP